MGDGHTTGLLVAVLLIAGVGGSVWFYVSGTVGRSGYQSEIETRESNFGTRPSSEVRVANTIKNSTDLKGKTADIEGDAGTSSVRSEGEPQNRRFIISAEVEWGYYDFVRNSFPQETATLFWRSGAEEEEHVIILENRVEIPTPHFRLMSVLLPNGSYNCKLVVGGCKEVHFKLSPETKSIRLVLRPTTRLHTTITSDSGAPLPAGTFLVFTSDPAWIGRDGRFVDDWKGWSPPWKGLSHSANMKRYGAKPIASAEVKAGQTAVDFELSPYWDGRKLFELPPEVEAVFVPKLDWPEWLQPPSRNMIFPAGRLPLGNLAADQEGVLNVVGFPELPEIPEIVAPEGMKLLWLCGAYPDHWHAGITGRIDGCAHISTKNGEGLVGFQREILADGSERITLEPPTWQEIGGVVLNEAGDPVDRLKAAVSFSVGERGVYSNDFRHESDGDDKGRFLLRYADLALPEVIYVYARYSSYKRSIVKLADVPDLKNIRVLLARKNE